MRVGWRLTGIILAGAFGIAVLSYWKIDLLTATVPNLRGQLGNQGPQPAGKNPSFKEVAIGMILNQDGFRVYRHGFKSSDGNGVNYSWFRPIGLARAADQFDKRLALADHVVVREPFRNSQGNVVGERGVIFFEGPRTHEGIAAVLLTDGSSLYSIESLSLYDALEFERQNPP